MWKVLYFAQLPGQYRLFGIPFHVQINCCRFVDHTPKSYWWKLISYVIDDKNADIFSFFTIVISCKLKKYQHNTDKTSCNLLQCFRNLLVKFCSKMNQLALPLSLSAFLKNNWLVIFGEFPRNCSISCGTVLWISTSVYVTPFSMWNKQ